MINSFPENWSFLLLEDCMEAIIDYRGKTPHKSSFGIPLITAKIVKGGRILEPTEFIPYEDYDERMQRGIPKAGDIVVSTEAPLGEVGQLDNRKLSVGQRLITLRGKDGLLDNTYLKFLMMSDFVQNQLVARATGTTVIGIKQRELRKISLVIPPIPEQHAIAGILGALDDKIEINRRMNVTLESMARAVFRQWFVENEEAENWEVKTIGDICEFAYGKGLKADKRNVGIIPVYGSNGQIGWHHEHLVKGPGIVVGRKGNPGIVTWAQKDFFPIDTTFYVVPKDKETSLYWLYYTLISKNLPDLGADSAVPGLNRNIAYTSDVNYPPYKIMKQYDEFTKPIFDQISANDEESRTLGSLRDSLLPKLMRGEVRVSAL